MRYRTDVYEAMSDSQEKLREMTSRMAVNVGRNLTVIQGLTLTMWNNTEQTDTYFYAPAIGIIIQGQKKSLIGNEEFQYGDLDCLVNGVDMPSISRVEQATSDKPLLAVALNIDRNLATELATKIPPAPGLNQLHLGVSVTRVDTGVLEAFVHLVELLDKPEQALLRSLFSPFE